jgi:hypothetical protein
VLPDVDPTQGLSRQVVDEAEDFETFTRWNFVLSQVAFIGVLALYAWRGARFTRESAAGRIGTGMLLGMLGLALAGLSQLPFQLADLWWQRRHELWKTGYVDWFVESWAGAGFLFICLWLLITGAGRGAPEALVAGGDAGVRRPGAAVRVHPAVPGSQSGGRPV